MKNSTIIYLVIGLAVIGGAYFFLNKKSAAPMNYMPSLPPPIPSVPGFSTAPQPSLKNQAINLGFTAASNYVSSLFK